MKQCPACKTTYTDDTLRFCLADGNPLRDLTDSQETVIQGGSFHDAETIAIAGGPASVDTSRETVQMSAPTPSPAIAKSGSSGKIFKVLMVLIGLGILGVVALAAGAFIYFNINNNQEKPANRDIVEIKTPATPVPSPTKDDEEELRDQIANLEKLINDQKGSKQPANIPLPDSGMKKLATVSSPGDGFLALRTLPSSDIGERIVKIPTGATVTVGFCGPMVKPVKRAGRWCVATYEGRTGWLFDAYLIY
ncbi:MAG: SH3 domain-containing protein [Acidobacteriota bacterium]